MLKNIEKKANLLYDKGGKGKKVMKNIVLKLLVIFLKILYSPMRLLKTQNKISLISRQSNKESIDFRKIREELESEYPEYKIKVITKKIEEKDGIFKQLLPNCINMFQQMFCLATSKVIVLDTYCITACILPHKKNTKIIQIWHALGAIKKFGYQTIGTKTGSNEKTAEIMCMHKKYDYVLAPSKATGDLYQKAFNVEEDRIKYIGMPRIDYILEKDEDKINNIYEKYPILKDENKQNILYVPTYRKGEKVEIDEFVDRIDTKKYNLIIKLHPLDLKEYEYKEKDGVIYEKQCKTYDLLKISDKVITDYSSLSIEASLLDIPIYFYTYDLEKYNEDTGVNFDFEKEPIGIYRAYNTEELLDLIDKNYDYTVLQQFKNKYISVNTKNCTKQIVEFIVRLMRNEQVESIGNEYIKEEQNI